MASKSDKPSFAEKLSTIDKVVAAINDKYGKKIVGRLTDEDIIDEMTIKFIPSKSDDLNQATGGGYPRSRCTIIAGPPDVGKTARLLEDIGFNMQNDPEFVALWIETEKSLEKNFLCKTFNIDPKRFTFIKYDPAQGGEGVSDILYGFLTAVDFDMVVINSLRCLVPKEIIDKSMSDMQPGIAARMNSRLCNKFLALVGSRSTAFILVTHVYAGIGPYSSPQVISGGNAIRYWSALTLLFTKKKIQKGEPFTENEALHIAVSIQKNHCVPDRNPYVKFDYYAVFGEGTDRYFSVIGLLEDEGILELAGSHYYFFDENHNKLENIKINGKGQYRAYMREHPEFFESLLKRLKNGGSTVTNMTEEEITKAEQEEAELEHSVKTMEEQSKSRTKKKSGK